MDLEDVKFPEAVVEAGCSTKLVINDLPAGATPVWLEIPDELAGDFLVTDVKVGINSQLSSTGPVPALLFSRGAPLDELLLDRVDSSHGSLSLDVTNTSRRQSVVVCRPIFSCEDSRLARYRRALILGLGGIALGPLSDLIYTVQPQRALDPDRLFVPSALLDVVEVSSLDVYTWVDKKGRGELVDSVPSQYLRRESLERDGIIHLIKFRSVGPDKCLVVKFKNRTDAEVLVTGAILGGEPIPWGDGC